MLELNKSNFKFEAGTDEAGRGCLAGPVTAAAVIIKDSTFLQNVNDSKQLNLKNRTILKKLIESEATFHAFSHIFENEIDEINILNASIKAMQDSISKLEIEPEFIIVDGNRFKPYKEIPYECIIKGDAKYLSIAAASIIAKTKRDEYMDLIHEEFPMYNWKQNKGYPTKEHRKAILEYGPCKYHRMSFRLLPKQLKLDL
ncbi:ribonuclease HII [Flavobacterium sp. I3-2]|uniref:ribonuclease HII n=1 Tax=Flavobacterium sp. I3-2 TaxID=2748319 RepID=UPI0015AFA759|nr:ribonuclease HII [Flavobacterium sp. I3-2]